MTYTKTIIVVTVLVILLSLYLVVSNYYTTREQLFGKLRAHQLLHAHHVAELTESLFWGHSRELDSLHSYLFSRNANLKEVERTILSYHKEGNRQDIREVTIFNETGRAVYSTDMRKIGMDGSQSGFFKWARERENAGKIFVSPSLQDESNAPSLPISSSGTYRPNSQFLVLMAIPIYKEGAGTKTDPSGRRFVGVLSCEMDLQPLLAEELRDSKLLNYFWIMDQGGTLLFHPEHPDIMSRRMNLRDPVCTQCHPSFDYAETILEEREGTLQYRIGNGPEEMAGFAPVKFGNESWVVVVCSRFGGMAADAGKDLRDHLTFLGIAVLALGGASVLIVRHSRQKVRAEEETRFWKERRSLENRIQEMERNRISQHLHDELGQNLTALKFRIGFMEKALMNRPGVLLDDCKTALQYTDQVIEDVRRISRELSPATLEHLGFGESLRWLVEEFRRRYHVETTLSLEEVDGLFPIDSQIIIYRILQETLTNVGKHAEASRVIIWIGIENGLFSLAVEDDGEGFEVEKTALDRSGHKGLGVITMVERAEMLGGTLEIKSEKGKGTRVTLAIPIKQEEASETDLSGGARR